MKLVPDNLAGRSPRLPVTVCGLLELCSNRIYNWGMMLFQDEAERQGKPQLTAVLHCSLPDSPPQGQGLSSPLRLLPAYRGALHISVPHLHPREHPTQRGTYQFRVREGACLASFSRRNWVHWWCPPNSCDFGRLTTILLIFSFWNECVRILSFLGQWENFPW